MLFPVLPVSNSQYNNNTNTPSAPRFRTSTYAFNQICKALENDCQKSNRDFLKYKKLFDESEGGDQGQFIEEVRDQHLRACAVVAQTRTQEVQNRQHEKTTGELKLRTYVVHEGDGDGAAVALRRPVLVVMQ